MFAAWHWRATETKIDPVGPSQADGVFSFLVSGIEYNGLFEPVENCGMMQH
jgi:hypothetical protein